MSRTRARGTGAVLMTAATLLASSLGQVVDPYGECARKVSNASFTTSLQNRCCVNRADCPSGTPLRCDSACANIWMPFASRCSMSLFASGIFPKLEAFSQKCEMTQYGSVAERCPDFTAALHKVVVQCCSNAKNCPRSRSTPLNCSGLCATEFESFASRCSNQFPPSSSSQLLDFLAVCQRHITSPIAGPTASAASPTRSPTAVPKAPIATPVPLNASSPAAALQFACAPGASLAQLLRRFHDQLNTRQVCSTKCLEGVVSYNAQIQPASSVVER